MIEWFVELGVAYEDGTWKIVPFTVESEDLSSAVEKVKKKAKESKDVVSTWLWDIRYL